MKKIIFILLLYTISSCEFKNKDEKNQAISSYEVNTKFKDKKYINGLILKSINQGDLKAYIEVSNIYRLEGLDMEFYYYSLIMANKYDCALAYFDMYQTLNHNSNVSFNGVILYSSDMETKKISTYYLLKSYELGLEQAKLRVVKKFGNNIPKAKDVFCK